MSDNNNIFSYTKRDYASSRKEGLSKIPTLSNGVWTDLNATDPGIIILDYVHALVDMINFYQDHQALETFITTAKERSNLFRLAKQFSYKIRSATSAKVNVTFHSDFYYDRAIKIPKGTNVRTKDYINFMTTEDAYIASGQSEVVVPCRQGTLYKKEYKGTGLSRFSNIEPPMNVNQTIPLTSDNIEIESITIIDNLGKLWKPVDSIVFSTEIDRVYEAELTPDNTVIIKFGDGERGRVPQETEILTVTYLVTDAEKGRIGEGGITAIVDNIYDDSGKYIELSVTNKEASVGGSSAQSSTSIRELAPGAIKAQDRAVTLSDFENLAKLVDGVADARAYDINTNPSIPYHEVRVLIIPEDISFKKVLVDEVYNYLYKRMIPPTNLHVTLPSSISINIDIVVKKSDDIDTGTLEYQISNTIKEYFNNRIGSIGEDFYPADLSSKISNLDSVRHIISMTPTSVVEIEELSIAVLGNLNITIQ